MYGFSIAQRSPGATRACVSAQTRGRTGIVVIAMLLGGALGCTDTVEQPCPVPSTSLDEGGAMVSSGRERDAAPPTLDASGAATLDAGSAVSPNYPVDCWGGDGGAADGAVAVDWRGAELAAYSSCAASACALERWQCNETTGPCRKLSDCLAQCACGDMACVELCGPPSAECSRCRASIDECVAAVCPVRACTYSAPAIDTPRGASSAKGMLDSTCADLAQCCSQADVDVAKTRCNQAYERALPQGDLACSFALTNLRERGVCR